MGNKLKKGSIFTDGRDLEYTLKEYLTVPNIDRDEYVSRLILANGRLKESVIKHNGLLKESLEKTETTAKAFFIQAEEMRKLKAEIESIKKTRIYKFGQFIDKISRFFA